MKKIVIAALLSVFVAAPAEAADGKITIGGNFGLDHSGVIGIMGEYDISSMTSNQPVSVQAFWKKSSESVPFSTVDVTSLGVAGIYDFNTLARLDKKLHPYAGVGIRSTKTKTTTSIFTITTSLSATSNAVYYVGGARYFLTPKLAADLNFNEIGGITVGVNYSF